MRNWFHVIPKNTGLSVFVWIVFCILPFYLIMRSSSAIDTIYGVALLILFFIAYRLSFISNNGLVYVWVSVEMAISIFTTFYFGYVYFALFLAYFIGNVKSKIGFFTLYILHLVTTIATITFGFFMETETFTSQLPFVIISIIGVILLPFNMYNRNKQEILEDQLEDANKKISELVVIKERQRIGRDLHDTMGQKLSLIGQKSDLAGKLVNVDPNAAKSEMGDINQTARTALKELREMVSEMKGARLTDEMDRVKQILEAAQIDCTIEGNPQLTNTPLLIENVLSMCLKEAVTNVVKHSHASACHIKIAQSNTEMLIEVADNGVGITDRIDRLEGYGMRGMRERLEFVNGHLDIVPSEGTRLCIRAPHVIQHPEQEEFM